MAAETGKLVARNLVSTYLARIHGGELDGMHLEINLPGVAVVTQGKYGRGVFPAVVSKARIPIEGMEDPIPPAAMVYPLQKKIKKAKTAELKLRYIARTKRTKAAIHDANQRAPKQYLTATDSQFKSGQNVVAGGTSVSSNMITAYMYVRRVSHDLDIDLRIYNMQTQNIVFSADIGWELNPEWMFQEGERQGWEMYYFPEEFIGLTWVTNDNEGVKVVFVVFSTGKVVATGIKSMDHRLIAEKRMQALIGPFRKGNEPASFDPARPHNRNASTLGGIKTELEHQQHDVIKVHASKDNAAKRNSKKLTHEVKDMMKTLAEVFVSAPEEDERNLFQQFLEAEV